ncbi:MAG: alpha/beta hydrolase [Chloroflexi bacterium]|nr:alpha/beta hydrolase [Chloroflexota bacterium]
MPFAHINSADIHYELDNFTDPWTKPMTFLLQHGFSRNSRFWYRWVPLLSGQFQVLRPDLRGLALSPVPTESYKPTEELFVGDVLGLLDHLGVEKVVYVGEPFGGIVGMLFALAHPERLHALVLIGSPIRVPREKLSKKFPVKEESWDAALAKGVDNWSRQTIGQRLDLDVAPRELVEWWISEMGRVNPQNAIKLDHLVARLDFTSHLSELKVPVLYLHGEKAYHISAEQLGLLRTQVPDCKVVTIPGVSSGLFALRPAECIGEIKTFLKERSLL